MEITQFIASHREVLLIGNYATYRRSLSRQLNSLRKKLSIATPKRDKFQAMPVNVQQIGSNHEFAQLLLLTAERAWAHAMHIKTSQADEGKGITGTGRSHIISKLHKAAVTAKELLDLLQGDKKTANATDKDLLEARAYVASLAGATEFEKHSSGPRPAGNDSKVSEERWRGCLRSYAEARVIYAALYEQEKKEVYRVILADTVDPTIRYAAYQAQLSRTIAIPTLAKRYFPKDDAELVSLVEGIDSWALKDKPAPKDDGETSVSSASVQEIPNSVFWRGRRANIVDASIGQAISSVTSAAARLQEYLTANQSASAKDKAAAYDDVLIASQDAADATQRATAELEKERVDEGDARMQDLRVTSLAVNYDLLSWRVGRNRVLIGEDDGLNFTSATPKPRKGNKRDGTAYPAQEESRGHKLARLKERAVLYDATIQSINSIKELRGAVRDTVFVSELDSQAAYFRALKCANISYSHGIFGQHVEALALLKRAHSLLEMHSATPSSEVDVSKPPTLALKPETRTSALTRIASLLSRTHALVELRKLEDNSAIAAKKNLTSTTAVVADLNTYPSPGTQVDISNLVNYPPSIVPVPVKPLFLDVAWNYIDYPGRKAKSSAGSAAGGIANTVSEKADNVVDSVMDTVNRDSTPEQPKKKGWFGFGR